MHVSATISVVGLAVTTGWNIMPCVWGVIF